MSAFPGSALAGWAIEALAASAVLIALVLLVRGPVRRIFGAPVAYALWALPVLRLLLPPLPADVREQVAAPLHTLSAPLSEVGQQVTILIAPAADSAAASSPITAGMTLALAWGLGAAAFLAWHLVAYVRFRRRLLGRAVTLDRVGGVTIVESAAAAGPLAFGIGRRFVAFPRDFAARYDADERELALAHELGHHQRGDLIANWVALAVLALHWFNPLAWYAFRAFRADQEMANDARVLAQLGAGARHAYACAIVKAAHGGAIAAACHLHTVDDLKGRLKMLGLRRASRTRVLAGMATVTATGLGALALTASGTQAAERMRAEVTEAAEVALAAPVAALTPAKPDAAQHTRVIVVRDGHRQVFEGKAAEAWVAANPVPNPPVPPVPPAPPMPDVPSAAPVPPVPPAPPAPTVPPVEGAYSYSAVVNDGHGRHVYVADRHSRVPIVREMACGGDVSRPVVVREQDGDTRRVTICTDRIARLSADASRRATEAAAKAVEAGKLRRTAMHHALSSIRAARGAILDNDHLTPTERDRALSDMDRELARLQDERDAAED